MFTTVSPLVVLAALAFGAPTQDSGATEPPYPTSTALAEGVSPIALAGLGDLVQSFVDEGEVVGAELLVLKNGKTILHDAYGWSDREADVPMATGSVFCVRSMTKPVIGAAILMLVDDDELELGDRVAEHLPAFDVDGRRDVTVEHLLTHTSGLPLSLILAKDLHELGDIQAVAALGGAYELDFEPGSAFAYSDQGTDTSTALIEVVSGMPAADFVRARVLEPLGMDDSACVMTADHPLRERALNKYAGVRDAWSPFWSPDDPPLFPFFLGSQGLYSTSVDYARFLHFWERRGRVGTQRLLRSRYVRKALTPGPYPFGGTGFPGLRAEYGYLMQLWTAPSEESEVMVFGHGGSDGTHAWAFPDQDAMVLYFTQSRGNTTGVRVEEALGELFLGAPYDPNQAAPPLEQYVGYYRDEENDVYRAIVRDGDDLAIEVLGKAVVPLTYAGEDRWKVRSNPSEVLAFERSETGDVTGHRAGDRLEMRFEPSPELPSADEIAARVAAAHRLDLVEALGPLRIDSDVAIPKFDLTGQSTSWLAWPDRWRADEVVGGEVGRVAFDGELVRYATRATPTVALEGQAAELLRVGNTFARFGDWRRWYPELRVIQRVVQNSGRVVLLVRAGGTSAPASTLYVDGETGRVGRVDGFTYVEGLGRIGLRLTFGDFRDVSGMLLPYRMEARFANPMVGFVTVETIVTDVALGVELPDGEFSLQD